MFYYYKMNNKQNKHAAAGFTLVEMLTVVAIIAILVSILVPVLAKQKTKARAKLARLDCSGIANAIKQYNMDHTGIFPMARGRQANTAGNDITFSMHDNGPDGADPTNAEIMIILSALTKAPEDVDSPDTNVNYGHSRNSKKFDYLKAKLVDSSEKPGMGPDGVYRDPFGNPYVVTVDKSGDGKCYDFFYGTLTVSGNGQLDGPPISANGLKLEDLPDGTKGYFLRQKVMVWSAGPDREVSDAENTLKGKNYDNIIGW